MQTLALSELLGSPVVDATGAVSGRVREVALYPHDDPGRVAMFVVRTRSGDRVLPAAQWASVEASRVHSSSPHDQWPELVSSEGYLLLERDLLDQQIIDVHGRKVVRVNDVDFTVTAHDGAPQLNVKEVEVGTRGAVRRLLKGIVPSSAVHGMASRFSPKVIPWDFVDLIEVDPSRRVRLKIEHDRLQKLHPADIADILEELAPAQREAVFESLDEDVAADALEEIDPKLQVSLLSSMDSERAADIVEEMDPDAAANLLADLPEERSEEILEEMEPEEREDVEELLEFREDTAGGHMTTDYIVAAPDSTVAHAIELLRKYEGGIETINTIFLLDAHEKLVGTVPLARIALASQQTPLRELAAEQTISCKRDTSEHDVAELFDKYNLMTLPVVDEQSVLLGIVTADDVISLLRRKL